MEEKLFGEQSAQNVDSIGKIASDAQKDFDKSATISPNETEMADSPYGKFKDAKSLLDAYNSLEAEFTRKSQKLADLTRGTTTSSQEKEALPTDATAVASASENENSVPMYKKADWKKRVSDYLEANPNAKSEAKTMSKILLENKEIAKSENCLDLAYKLSLAQKYVEPAKLAQDDEFIKEYIGNNQRAKDLIVSQYIQSLQSRQVAPQTIMGQPKALVASPSKPIGSMEKAREITLKLFT